jgi:hypothetical protein
MAAAIYVIMKKSNQQFIWEKSKPVKKMRIPGLIKILPGKSQPPI